MELKLGIAVKTPDMLHDPPAKLHFNSSQYLKVIEIYNESAHLKTIY